METNPLQVKTAAKAGSGKLLWINFNPVNGSEDGTESFGIEIIFSDPPQYTIKFCHDLVDFSLPNGEVHVWNFAKTDCCVVIHCNGALIVKYDISSSLWKTCQKRWGRDIGTFKFVSKNVDNAFDNASISYRAQPTGFFQTSDIVDLLA